MKIFLLSGLGIAAIALGLFTALYAYPKMTLFSENKVAQNFSRMERIFPSIEIAASPNPIPLPTALQPLPETLVVNGQPRDLAAFLDQTKTTSLLIVKDGTIIVDDRFQGYGPDTLATSFSVAKSFVATLVGMAVHQGLIGSLEDPVTDYLPELTGSGFDGATIADLLQMTSGVNFTEIYNDSSTDAYKIYDQMFVRMRSIDTLAAGYGTATTPGEQFYYASINTHVLSMILRRVSGQSLSGYLQTNLWQTLGTEREAHWLTDIHGTEIGFWGLEAHPHDFARLGLLMLSDGAVNGQRLLPEGWVHLATTPDKPFLQPGQIDEDWGYQYSWWVPRDGGDYSAIGIWGQFIYVNPRNNIIIVKNSADADFKANEYPTIELFRALAEIYTD